jgi:hypothetical protein
MRAVVVAAGALALVLWASLALLALRGERETVTVVGFEWRREIEVEACAPGARPAGLADAGADPSCRSQRFERSRGTDRIPRWPLVRLQAGEREARRSESYVVLLRGRRVYVMELPKPRWSALRPGETHSVRIRRGRVLELS